MKRITQIPIFALILFFCSLEAKSQVTIGSNYTPSPNALLDLKEKADSTSSKGLLLPRVALTATNSPIPLTKHVAGMTVYNTATTSAGNGYDVSRGFYYNDGTKWVALPLSYTNWFYMPSVSFDTSTPGTALTKDLYALYYGQFSSPAIKSTGAPSTVPFIPSKTDLYYYITDYDTSVFDHVSIDANGVMTYDIIGTPTECSYINIIFVLK